MNAVTPNAKGHAELSALASRFVDVDDLPWERAQFPGVEYKTLFLDRQSGVMTVLLRMAPGARLPDHEHARVEQTYVLEGTLVDDDGVVTAGNFVWRPAGSRHSAHTPDGGLMLAFFLRPNRFFGADGKVTDMLGRDYEATWG
jgi:anti-sigma factor ChrR (cupin superfamily)